MPTNEMVNPPMDPRQEFALLQTRRYFLGRCAAGIGTMGLASILNPNLFGGAPAPAPGTGPSFGILPALHHRATAKRVIWLFMADAPSQIDLFDYKPKMHEFFD